MYKSILTNPFFLGSLLFFALHQFIERVWEIRHSFLDSYLDDVLALPVFLSLFLLERRWILGIEAYRLSFLEALVSAVVLSLIFELVFPLVSSRFIYDPFDFLAYAIGFGVFWVGINPFSE